jgi:hypothetical protein
MGLLDIAELGLAVWFVFILTRYARYFYWKLRSRSSPVVPGNVQRGEVLRGNSKLFGMYRSTLGYAYKIENVRYVGAFALITNDETTAARIQKEFEGMLVSVRYNYRHPEKSFLVQEKLNNRPIYQNPFWFE